AAHPMGQISGEILLLTCCYQEVYRPRPDDSTLRFLAYSVDCDQAFALCCLFCVRMCQFACPEGRLAAIARPHTTADLAQNATRRAVRADAQRRNDARTG